MLARIDNSKKEPRCPICGGKMKYRAPAKNTMQSWTPYWSCLNFPDCNGLVKLEDVKIDEQDSRRYQEN